MTFTNDFQHVLLDLSAGDSRGLGNAGSWMLSQSPMSTSEILYFSDGGYEVNLELRGGFNGDLNHENYKSQIQAATLHWWPEEFNDQGNFVNQLHATGLVYYSPRDCLREFGVAIVPEPASVIIFGLGLLGLFHCFRRNK
jgi:hypothetical protein